MSQKLNVKPMDYYEWLNHCATYSKAVHDMDVRDILVDEGVTASLLRDTYDSHGTPEQGVKSVILAKAKLLWQKLGDIPVNELDELDEPFLNFEVGCTREIVWHWFESEFGCSVAEDLIGVRNT